jgi:hypothetical protein
MRSLFILSLVPLVSAGVNTPQGDGTVKQGFDTYWQQCAVGLSGENCELGKAKKFTYEQAERACDTLKLAGKKWRLPDREDLEGDLLASGMPAIDRAAFPNTPPALFWTSSMKEYGQHYAVDFYEGEVVFRIDNMPLYVRCVSP